jgi:hypothetical protein
VGHEYGSCAAVTRETLDVNGGAWKAETHASATSRALIVCRA